MVDAGAHTREPIDGSVSVAHSNATGGPGAPSQRGMHALQGEASAGVSEADMILIQDFMMAASQLKALTTEGGTKTKVPAISCEHSRLARPSKELCRWDRNKLQATLGPRLERLLTSPTGPTRIPPRHVEAHTAPSSVDPFNIAAAIERMGREIGRGMMPLAMNQQRMDKL